MGRMTCLFLFLAMLACPLTGRAQSPNKAALQEKAEAASDALARCAYFLALDALPSRWKVGELKRVIVHVCRSQMANHERAVDAAWRNGKPDDDKIDLNEKLKSDEEMYPSAMVVVGSVLQQYDKSLKALRR